MKKMFAAVMSTVTFFAMAVQPMPVLSADTDELWEKFLRYDLCILNYDALTDEEQALCRFIYDTEQGTTETVRCERARRTLAKDPHLGKRITLEQLENISGICDWYAQSRLDQGEYLHCVPDIRHLDGFQDYNEYWLDDTGTDYIKSTGDCFTFQEMVHIAEGKEPETLISKESPHFDRVKTEDGVHLVCDNISDFADWTEENGDYYYFDADGNAMLAISQYKRLDFTTDVTEPITEPVIIPDTVQGHPVTAIESGAFQFARIREVQMPETVEYIHCAAFETCFNLQTINMPPHLKLIGNSAFSETALSELILDAPELDIAANAFRGCLALNRVSLNVHSVGENAFIGCGLTELTLGDAVTKLEAGAFSSCDVLENLTLPDSLRVIGAGALPQLHAVTVPETVEIIGALPKQKGIPPTSGMPADRTYPLTDDPVCAFAEDCAVSGYHGSEAERYAEEWNLPFIPLDITEGDLNHDVILNSADAVLLQKWLHGMQDAELYCWHAADFSRDAVLNAADLTLMKKNIMAKS